MNTIEKAKAWIAETIEPCTKAGMFSSYGLKHCYEHDTRQYISNADFKKAMVESGYMPTKQTENLENWRFHYKAKKGKELKSIG